VDGPPFSRASPGDIIFVYSRNPDFSFLSGVLGIRRQVMSSGGPSVLSGFAFCEFQSGVDVMHR